jgi:hypothetical protein
MKKAVLISGVLALFFLNPLFSLAQEERIRSKILKMYEIQHWLFKIVHERDNEKKIYELVKLLGVYQSGNTATIYYSYAVTDRPTGDRKVYKVATLYVIKFNSREWFSPKGFSQGSFISK